MIERMHILRQCRLRGFPRSRPASELGLADIICPLEDSLAEDEDSAQKSIPTGATRCPRPAPESFPHRNLYRNSSILVSGDHKHHGP